MNLITTTRLQTGLRVRAQLDPPSYEAGVKAQRQR